MTLHPDEYLDLRSPAWLDAELLGHVRYDPALRTILIEDRRIEREIERARSERPRD